MSITHDLKCWPAYYDAIVDGRKPFEVRLNDRDYHPGDVLILHRYDPVDRCYTGEATRRRVTYMLRGGGEFPGLADGYVVMGLGFVLEDDPLRAATSRATAEIARLTAENAALRKRVGDLRRLVLAGRCEARALKHEHAAVIAFGWNNSVEFTNETLKQERQLRYRRALLTGGNDK